MRFIITSVLLLGLAWSVRAGELDRETGPAPLPVPTAMPSQVSGSELDQETPDQSWYRRGFWGVRPWGFRPWGFAPYRAFAPAIWRYPAVRYGWGGAYWGLYGGFYNAWYSYRPVYPFWAFPVW